MHTSAALFFYGCKFANVLGSVSSPQHKKELDFLHRTRPRNQFINNIKIVVYPVCNLRLIPEAFHLSRT